MRCCTASCEGVMGERDSHGLMLGKRFLDLFQGRSASEVARSCSSFGSSWRDAINPSCNPGCLPAAINLYELQC